MKSKRELKNLLQKYKVPTGKEENIVKTIELGQNMMGDILTTDNSLFNFVKEQCRYISSYLWLTQFILMIVMMFLTSDLVEPKINVPRVLFTMSSIFVFIGVPELVKSMIYNMSELEYACKHSMPKILVTRLLIISMTNVFATTIMISFLSIRHQISFVEILLYGFVPLSIANGINFLLINLLKAKSIITFMSSSIFSGALMINFTGSEIFTTISQMTWIFIFIISLLVLFIEVYYLIKKLDKGEALILWN